MFLVLREIYDANINFSTNCPDRPFCLLKLFIFSESEETDENALFNIFQRLIPDYIFTSLVKRSVPLGARLDDNFMIFVQIFGHKLSQSAHYLHH